MCQISTGKQMKQNTNKKNEEKKEEGNFF